MEPGLQGVIAAPITPMNADLSIDTAGMAAVVEHLIVGGVHGLTPCAQTGEAETLSVEEHRLVIETTVQATAGRVPVYAGIGRASLLETMAMVDVAARAGADGLFLITPYASAYCAAEAMEYYRMVAAASTLPVMVYNSFAYSQLNLTPGMLAELARLPAIDSVKEGNQNQLAATIVAAGDDMAVFTARDSHLASSLVIGAKGVVSFVANIAPNLIVAMYQAWRRQDLALVARLQPAIVSLVDALTSRSYPALVKSGMALAGLPAGPARRAAVPLSDAEQASLRTVIAVAGLSGVG